MQVGEIVRVQAKNWSNKEAVARSCTKELFVRLAGVPLVQEETVCSCDDKRMISVAEMLLFLLVKIFFAFIIPVFAISGISRSK